MDAEKRAELAAIKATLDECKTKLDEWHAQRKRLGIHRETIALAAVELGLPSDTIEPLVAMMMGEELAA